MNIDRETTSPEKKPPFKKSGTPLLIILILFMFVTVLRYKTRAITDDAFITYRYARNLIEGKGLVYNPGERVLGTTTPLYTFLMAGAMACGVKPWHASLILDCFFVTAILWIILQWGELVGDRIWCWGVVILMFLDPLSILPVAGMETGLFILLVYGSFLLSAKNRHFFSVILSLSALFTRPEGGLALILVLAPALWDFQNKKMRPEWKKILLITIIPLSCAALLMKVYYGTLIIQSIKAKHAQTNFREIWKPFFDWFFQRQFFPHTRFDIKGILEWIGFVLIFIRYPRLRLFLYWFILYLLFMKLGRAPHFVHYYTPLYPIQMMALCMTLLTFVRFIVTFLYKKIITLTHRSFKTAHCLFDFNSPLFIPLFLILFHCLSPFYIYASLRLLYWIYFDDRPSVDCKRYEYAGQWIKDHSQPADEVMTPEIGYIGYFSERRIFDIMGLVSPQAVSELGKTSIWEWAVRRNPEFVVYPLPLKGFTKLPVSFVKKYQMAKFWIHNQDFIVVFKKNIREIQQLPGQTLGIDPRKSMKDYSSVVQ